MFEGVKAAKFQSTLLQEERHKQSEDIPTGIQFQSTLLQEERQGWGIGSGLRCDFNPRSYKRSDGNTFSEEMTVPIFQSTLLQEERPG